MNALSSALLWVCGWRAGPEPNGRGDPLSSNDTKGSVTAWPRGTATALPEKGNEKDAEDFSLEAQKVPEVWAVG